MILLCLATQAQQNSGSNDMKLVAVAQVVAYPNSSTTNEIQVTIGESSISALLLNPKRANFPSTRGAVVDPRQPDFEMYTSKIVLLRVPVQGYSDADLSMILGDIVSAEPKGIIVISKKEGAKIRVEEKYSFALPIVQVAAKDSTSIIQAAQNHLQVAIQAK